MKKEDEETKETEKQYDVSSADLDKLSSIG